MTRADRSRLPDVGPDPAFRFPEIVRHRLANGLEVRTVEHHNVPVITFLLQVEGGAGADTPGREGLAALTADMIDEGTGSLTALDVSDALARIGAEYDVDVGADVTSFSVTTLTRFAGRGGSLLADLCSTPSLRDQDLQRVRQLRLDRLRQLKDLAPAVAERTFLRLLYGDHPYGHLAIGTDSALRALSLDDVADLHERMFRPTRAMLVVSGALSHAELLDAASQAFGGWRGAGEPEPDGARAEQTHPAQPGRGRLVVVPRERAAQSELRIGHLAARRDTPDYHALVVLNAVLGGQFVSRVNLKLREEKGYTYGARTAFDWRRGIGPFSLQTSVHTAVTADAVRDATGEIAAIRGDRPVSEAELSLAQASLTKGYARNFETAGQVARAVAQLALYRLPDRYFEDFVPTINGVTTAEVTRVARHYLRPDELVTLVVGDHSAIADSLAELPPGSPEVMAPL